MCIRDSRYTVREYGLTLFGPPPVTLIDPVSADDVRAATAGVLRSWWGTPEAEAYIRDAPPLALALYVVPTMCRALYALEHGRVISKPAACRWALATLDARRYVLIEQSLARQLDESLTSEMIAFVQYVTTAA